MKILVVKKNGIKNIYLKKLENALNNFSWKHKVIDYNEIDNYYNSVNEKKINEKFDMLISFGGDGTILKSARLASELNISVLGINAGTLGFLTSINDINSIDESFKKIAKNEYYYENRYMIETKVLRKNKVIFKTYAVNEATITTKNIRKIGKYNVFINDEDELFNEYSADGLIISTPTGSTAHSLSAGGPIVEPNVKCFILTAVCPHAFNERSIIISDDKKIIVKVLNDDQLVDIDGRVVEELNVDDRVIISKLKKPVKYITFNKNFFITNIKNKIKKI